MSTKEMAQKIYELFDPWDLDYASIDDIEKDLESDPNGVIEYLLGTIEDLRG